MAAVTIARGLRVLWNGQAYRLGRLIDDDTWQLEDLRTGRFSEVKHMDLLKQYHHNTIRFQRRAGPNEQLISVPDTNPARYIGPSDLVEALRRERYVNGTIDLPLTRPPKSRSKEYVDPLESAIAKIAAYDEDPRPPSLPTLARWRRRYLAQGRSIAALVPQRHKCGRKALEIGDDLLELIEEALDATFLTENREPLTETMAYLEGEIDAINAVRPRGALMKMPTLRQVKKVLYAIPAVDRCIARFGPDIARMRFRGVLKHHFPRKALDTAQIDHSRIDCIVLDDDTWMPLGRPWITICLEVKTRAILGVHVSFTAPSFRTVASCLRHSFFPKHDLKKRYPSIKCEWLAHGAPDNVLVDNALEFHSDAFAFACGEIPINIIYAPRRAGWFKPHVERALGTLNREVTQGLPGRTFANIFDRADYDPTKHAVVRFSTFLEILFKWIVDVYHQKPHRGLKGQTPAGAWKQFVNLHDIRYPEDPERFHQLLGRRETRMLSHKGVEVEGGLLYNSPELIDWRKRVGDKFEVTVIINDDDLGSVIVTDDKSHRFTVPCTLKEYATGLSLWAHDLCKKYAKEKLMEASKERAWITAKREIRQLVEAEFDQKRASRRVHMKAARVRQEMPDSSNPADVQKPSGSVAKRALPHLFATRDSSNRPPATGRPPQKPAQTSAGLRPRRRASGTKARLVV